MFSRKDEFNWIFDRPDLDLKRYDPKLDNEDPDNIDIEDPLFDLVGHGQSSFQTRVYPDYAKPMDNTYNSPNYLFQTPTLTYPMQIAELYPRGRVVEGKVGSSANDIEDIVTKAIWADQKVKIYYAAESDNFSEVVRNVSPINLRQTKKGFFLAVSVNAWREIRTYRLDRIRRIEELFLPAFEHSRYKNYFKLQDNSNPEITAERSQVWSGLDPIQSLIEIVEKESSDEANENEDFVNFKDGLEQLEGLVVPISEETFKMPKGSGVKETLELMYEKWNDFAEGKEDMLPITYQVIENINWLVHIINEAKKELVEEDATTLQES